MFVKSLNGEALLVLDCQEDFVRTSSQYRVEKASECVAKVSTVVQAARLAGVPVVWVVQEFSSSGIDEPAATFRRHLFQSGAKGICVTASQGAALAPPLAAKEGEVYVRRTRTSAFFSTNLDVMLRRLGVSRIILVGLHTPTSIRCSAFDGISCDYEVSVIRDAVAAAQGEAVQDSNLADMDRAGVTVLNSDLYIASLVMKSVSPSSLVTMGGEGLSQSIHLAGSGFQKAGEGISFVGGALTGGFQQLGGFFASVVPGSLGGERKDTAANSGGEKQKEQENVEEKRRRQKAEDEKRQRERVEEEKKRREREEEERKKRSREKDEQERQKKEAEKKERERAKEAADRATGGNGANDNPLAQPFLAVGAAAEQAVKATHNAIVDTANKTVSATTNAASAIGIGKDEKKPTPAGGAHAWPSLTTIQQAMSATGSAVADAAQKTVKATEDAYKATENAVKEGASKTATFVSDTTTSAVSATNNVASAIGKGATTSLR